MKATKKIVGAACALVAAVALSAGSTFAWFAQNAKVTVTGVKVQATVPTNIYIENGYKSIVNDVNKTAIDYSEDKTKTGKYQALTPAAITTSAISAGVEGAAIDLSGKTGSASASSVNESSGALDLWLYTSPALDDDNWATKPTPIDPGSPKKLDLVGKAKIDSQDAAKFTWDETSKAASGTNEDYVAIYDMTLANKAAAVGINATVTVTSQSGDETVTFLRVGFVVGTQTEAAGAMTYNYFSIENDDATALVTGSGGTFTYNNLIASFTRDTVATVTFLVWYDGNDSDCFVNHAKVTNAITVDITFNAAT